MKTNPFVIEQEYESYSADNHKVWSLLYHRQSKLIRSRAADEFLKGFALLSLDPFSIPKITVLNQRLRKTCGWSVAPVIGLIPAKDFLFMLQKKEFPITVAVRRMDELDFASLPDIFHDIFGHVPMLMNPLFSGFLHEYSKIAVQYMDNEKGINALARFYWYTLEMGLISEDGVIKPYGGAILTSAKEIDRVLDPAVHTPFSVSEMLRTEYDLTLQKEYYVIDSFQQLVDSLKQLRSEMEEIVNEKIAMSK
jgi:phenylalanine-4-hydroxylase